MKTRLLMAAAAASLTLHAAAVSAGGAPDPRPKVKRAMQEQPTDKRSASLCSVQECVITVSVDKCVVTADPYYIVMTGKAPVKMVWRIKGNGAFVPEAIRWKEAAGRAVFRRATTNDKEVVFENGRRNGIYHYGITVREGDTVCPELDPTGINDMGPSP